MTRCTYWLDSGQCNRPAVVRYVKQASELRYCSIHDSAKRREAAAVDGWRRERVAA